MTIAAILAERSGGEVHSAACDMPLKDAIAILAERRIGALPVLKDDKVVGIISERDVIYGLQREGSSVLDKKVEEVMTSPAITVEPKVTALGALSQMSKRRIRHLPVVEGDALVGIVSIGDLVQYRIDRIEREAEAMRDYIRSA